MRGPNLRAMAWRNLWRNRRRTIVTLSSLTFAVLLFVLHTALADASFGELIDFAARMGGGHVTLQHPDYLDAPTLARTVRGVDALTARARAEKGVVRVTTRITGQVLLATAGQSAGATFIAIDPQAEDARTLAVMDSVAEGKMLPARRGRGIVLGARLAENLRAGLGRKVVYTLTDKRGEIVTGLARVTGIVKTGAPGLDGALCLLPIDTVREVLGYAPDEGTLVAVFLRDHRRSAAVAARLGRAFGGKVAALTWRETQPDLAGFIAMKLGGKWVMQVIIMVLVGAGIFNTLFVSVMERLREFGILMAIGFSPGRLFRLVTWESLWLALVGLAVGAAVTAGPYYYLQRTGIDTAALFGGEGRAEVAGAAMTTVLHARIHPENALAIAGVVFLATMLAGLYPAWRAGRVVPIETIRLV